MKGQILKQASKQTSGQTLEQAMQNRSRNLQLIKWIAALLVIASHAYPIALGSNETEPLLQLTNGQLSMGGLAVGVFFFSAGLLIARSVEHKHEAKAFFTARCRRIFPSLFAVVVLSIIMGAVLTTLSLKEYISSIDTWKYLGNAILIPVHNLPGVFAQNPYLPTVNGALWTLPVECCCYVACFMLYHMSGFDRKKNRIPGVLIVLGCIATVIMQNRIPGVVNILRPCLLFGIGVLYWIYGKKLRISGLGAVTGCILFLLCLVTGFANVGMYLFFPYIMTCLSYATWQVPEPVAKLGNLSYGIYLCGFPIQQTVVHVYQSWQATETLEQIAGGAVQMTPLQNMAIAIPMAIVVGGILYLTTERV